jgi:curli biogenesis system outer membrane secretion channel CsgG
LVRDGTYSVIERKAMDKILAEQNFSNSDRGNPASAAKLGKLLGVDAIIVGSVTQFDNDTQGGCGQRRIESRKHITPRRSSNWHDWSGAVDFGSSDFQHHP